MQFLLGLLIGTGRADDLHDQINIVNGDFQALNDMLALFSFMQIKSGTSDDDLFLMLDIVCEHLLQCQNLRHTVNECQINHAEIILHLRIFIQMIEDDLRIGIAFEFDDDTHTFTVGLIAQIGNTVDFFIADQFGDTLD